MLDRKNLIEKIIVGNKTYILKYDNPKKPQMFGYYDENNKFYYLSQILSRENTENKDIKIINYLEEENE